MSTPTETHGSPFLPLMKTWIGKSAQEVDGVPTPTGIWLNGILRKVEAGYLQFEHTVRKEMTNPAGQLHGGMLATMIDDCMGGALTSLTVERFYTTVDLHVNYLGSARLGDKIWVEAQVVRAGRRMAFMKATVTNEGGKLLAEATSNLLAVEQG